MQIDALAIRLRPRTPYEAADLGVRLCQSAWRDVYRCYAAVALPVFGLCIATSEFSGWLPGLAIWWMKPWLDRTILFVLSRAAFGQRTSLSDLWRAQRQVWWSQLIQTLTWRRLSPWRSFTQPVYQLEGLSFGQIRKRVLQIRRDRRSSAFFVTGTYSSCETALTFAIFSLLYWFAPLGQAPDLLQFFMGEDSELHAALRCGICRCSAVPGAVLRGVRICHVPEPSRRAGGVGYRAGVSSCVRALRLCVVAALALSAHAFAQDVERPNQPVASNEITQRDIATALEVVRKDPNLAAEGKMRTLHWVTDDTPEEKATTAQLDEMAC